MSTVTLSTGRVVELREPKAGELRGVKLLDLLQLDPAAHATVVDRTTEMTAAEFYALGMVDAARIMRGITDFFPQDLAA
jgi:hypothetical protein